MLNRLIVDELFLRFQKRLLNPQRLDKRRPEVNVENELLHLAVEMLDDVDQGIGARLAKTHVSDRNRCWECSEGDKSL